MIKKEKNRQTIASRKDYAKNKEARKRSAYHRQARLFIRSYANNSDIEELRDLLNHRELKINNDTKKSAPSN